jgi:hypothetical protein
MTIRIIILAILMITNNVFDMIERGRYGERGGQGTT